jgi:hypothetical protein
MNKNDLKELYRLEEKLQLLDAELKTFNEKFDRERKGVWNYIHTLTKGLRDGEKLK